MTSCLKCKYNFQAVNSILILYIFHCWTFYIYFLWYDVSLQTMTPSEQANDYTRQKGVALAKQNQTIPSAHCFHIMDSELGFFIWWTFASHVLVWFAYEVNKSKTDNKGWKDTGCNLASYLFKLASYLSPVHVWLVSIGLNISTCFFQCHAVNMPV